MAIKPIYREETVPVEGYEDVSFSVLQNPTGAQIEDYYMGALGTPAERERITAAQAILAKPGVQQRERNKAQKELSQLKEVLLKRERYGRALHAFYRDVQVEGFDFGSPEAALATMARLDLPDELIYWLQELPYAIWQDRRELIKNFQRSSKTAS